MKDRVPTHPGRVKLTPVSGYIYDMQMADEPSEYGTPLNKATLLTDATANAIDDRYDTLPTTPNEALALLANGAARMEIQTYIGNGTYGQGHENSITFDHVPKFVFIIRDAYISSINAFILNWAKMSTNGGVFVRIGDTGTYTSNNYTLSSNRKTLTWYANASSSPVGEQMQMNESGNVYTVISFY